MTIRNPRPRKYHKVSDGPKTYTARFQINMVLEDNDTAYLRQTDLLELLREDLHYLGYFKLKQLNITELGKTYPKKRIRPKKPKVIKQERQSGTQDCN